jgi:hypothetical protein
VEVTTLAGQRIFDSGMVTRSTLDWPMVDAGGRAVASGVYLYTVTLKGANGSKITQKLGKVALMHGQGTTAPPLLTTLPTVGDIAKRTGPSSFFDGSGNLIMENDQICLGSACGTAGRLYDQVASNRTVMQGRGNVVDYISENGAKILMHLATATTNGRDTGLLTGGTAGTKNIAFLGDTGGNGDVLLAYAGSGKVGIGTTSPAEKLHVVGDVRLECVNRCIHGYSGNSVTSGVEGATISGGGDSSNPNRVTDDYGTVGGGGGNQAGDNAGSTADRTYATVAGGFFNTASGAFATTIGGRGNLASADSATVGGGHDNTASAIGATVGGGSNNTASDTAATVGGGFNNIASGSYATVSGGYFNTASGDYAMIPGGESNSAPGDYSFAAGRLAKAHNSIGVSTPGTFIWADSRPYSFFATASDQFRARTTGGAQFVLGLDGVGDPAWTCSVSNGSSWSCSSDRNLKEHLVPVDGRGILRKLSELPIYTWSAKGTAASVRHMGPMAQDFYAAFGLGDDAKLISTIDLDGVSLAAIQALYELSLEKDKQIEALQAFNAELQQRLEALEGLVQELKEGMER